MTQLSPYTTQGTAREHTVLIDRPEAKGGTDRGMMGGEMLLVALGGCFNSNLLEVIRTRDADITDIHIDVIGTLDGTPSRYTAIEMQISANYTDREQFEKFVNMAERACIVANSLKSGIDLTVTILEPDAITD
jgi:putative redox protein